jgi:hypothetical protein
MFERTGLKALFVLAVLAMTWPAAGQMQSDELIVNSGFQTRSGVDIPDGWSVWKPQWTQAACQVRGAEGGLLVKSEHDPFGVGGVTQQIKGVRGGQAYAIRAVCEVRNVASPFRSAIVRLGWLKGGKLLDPSGMLVRGPRVDGGRATFSDVFVAPKDADGAQVSLEVKWPGEGEVVWKQMSLRPTADPRPRKVKIGTVYLRPRNSTPQKNLELWCEQIDAAGKLGLDIVCLGETVTRVGTNASLEDTAELIPGPATKRLGEAAGMMPSCTTRRSSSTARVRSPAPIERSICLVRSGRRGSGRVTNPLYSIRISAGSPCRYVTTGSSPKWRRSSP